MHLDPFGNAHNDDVGGKWEQTFVDGEAIGHGCPINPALTQTLTFIGNAAV
jgi:hypothetical protein